MNEQRVLGTVMPSLFVWVAAFLLNVVLGPPDRDPARADRGPESARLRQWDDRSVLPGVRRAGRRLRNRARYRRRRLVRQLHDRDVCRLLSLPGGALRIEPALVAIAAGVSTAAGFAGALFRDAPGHRALSGAGDASARAAALPPVAARAPRSRTLDANRRAHDPAQPRAPPAALRTRRRRRRRRRGADHFRHILVGRHRTT